MKIGVSVVAFVKVPRVPPVVSAHWILELLLTVTKSGRVKVSPHMVIAFVEVIILGFWWIVMVIESVTATWGQFAFGKTDIVKVTLEVSFEPKI